MTAPAGSAGQEVCPVSSHRRRRRSWLRWVLVAAAVVVVFAVGGPFVYIHFIEGPAPAPLRLSDSASPGAPATGKLTLHGQTRQVTFDLKAERTATQIRASGSIPITFADWGIPNPSFGSFVTTENHGVMEFLLVLQKR